MISRRTSSIPKEDVFPRLLYSDSMCSQVLPSAPGGHYISPVNSDLSPGQWEAWNCLSEGTRFRQSCLQPSGTPGCFWTKPELLLMVHRHVFLSNGTAVVIQHWYIALPSNARYVKEGLKMNFMIYQSQKQVENCYRVNIIPVFNGRILQCRFHTV